MSEADERSPLDRVRAIERGRAHAAWRALFASTSTGLLLATSFALGHRFGPTPLQLSEAAVIVSGFLLVAVLAARPLARRWRDQGALGRWLLQEGRARRRALIFEDYVLLDEEVVLKATVDRAERCEDRLLLRYQDPVAAGPLLRELTGPTRGLDAVADALQPGA